MPDNKHYEKAKTYWNNLLRDYTSMARFPNDYFKDDTGKFSMIQKEIKKATYSSLLSFCDSNKLSLDSVLDTVFAIVLQRFSCEDDIVFAKNKIHLPIRVNPSSRDMRFTDLARDIMRQTSDSMEYYYYMISSEGHLNSLNDKLINTAFYFDVFADRCSSTIKEKDLDLYMKVSLTKGMSIKLMYKPSYYDKVTARSIIYLFKHIINQIIAKPKIRLRDIKNIKDVHKDIYIGSQRDNKFSFDRNLSYIDLFRGQVRRTPDKIAVSDEFSSMTYKEVDELTDKVAGYFNHIGIGVGSTVAVLQVRTKNVVLAAISILKSGAIFFPIDRTNPDERVGYLLEDGEVDLVLTCRELGPRVKEKHSKYKYLNLDHWDRIEKQYEISQKSGPKDIAYRISTSGTTGRPKCISIRQESLMNMCHFAIDYIGANENDVCGIYLSFSFDAIVKQIFPYLLIGASVDVLPEESRKNEYTVEDYCKKKGVTILALPAILGKLFVNNCPCDGLKVLQVGGDKFKGYTNRNYKIYNEYGPAEFTVLCSQFYVDKYYELVPVGRPIYNTEAYILDKNSNLCAVGMPGELCLSGIQISEGYSNRPELNEGSFVCNPFAHDDDTRLMYRTGDLAKIIDESGNIAVLGRMDSQIKINGIRIELFEIENMINMLAEVKNAVVVAKEDQNGDKYLDAYIVAYDKSFDGSRVLDFLKQNLPPHMIPRHILSLESMPVTPIGKVDKKALPPIY